MVTKKKYTDARHVLPTLCAASFDAIPRGGEVLGVFQFINKLDPVTNAVVPFPVELVPLVEALAAQAAVTLANLALQDAQLARAGRNIAGRGWRKKPGVVQFATIVRFWPPACKT